MGGLNNRDLLSHSSDDQKLKIKVLAGQGWFFLKTVRKRSVPGLSLCMAVFSLCLFSLCMSVCVQISPLCKSTSDTRAGPTLSKGTYLQIRTQSEVLEVKSDFRVNRIEPITNSMSVFPKLQPLVYVSSSSYLCYIHMPSI